MKQLIYAALITITLTACAPTEFSGVHNQPNKGELPSNDSSTGDIPIVNNTSTYPTTENNDQNSAPAPTVPIPVNTSGERHLCLAKWIDYPNGQAFVLFTFDDNVSFESCKSGAFQQTMAGIPGRQSRIDFYYISKSAFGAGSLDDGYIRTHFAPTLQYRP